MLVEGRFDEEVMPADIIVSAKDGIKAHYCYYCPSDVRQTQIHRHLRLMHADEKEMKEVKNEKDSTIGGLKMTLLKLKGDHLHNLEVVRQKRGYLQVARAATNASADEFVPCAFCKVCKLEVVYIALNFENLTSKVLELGNMNPIYFMCTTRRVKFKAIKGQLCTP